MRHSNFIQPVAGGHEYGGGCENHSVAVVVDDIVVGAFHDVHT